MATYTQHDLGTLKNRREDLRLSISNMTDLTGINFPRYISVETGVSLPTTEEWQAILNAFETVDIRWTRERVAVRPLSYEEIRDLSRLAKWNAAVKEHNQRAASAGAGEDGE